MERGEERGEVGVCRHQTTCPALIVYLILGKVIYQTVPFKKRRSLKAACVTSTWLSKYHSCRRYTAAQPERKSRNISKQLRSETRRLLNGPAKLT